MPDKIEYVNFREGDLSGVVRSDHRTDFRETVASYGGDCFRWCKNRPKIGAGVVGSCFIKCYHYNGIYSQIRHIFRISRAVHCARCAENLLNLQISTPAVIGYCRRSRFGLPVCDFLVTGALERGTVFFDRIFPDEPETAAAELAALAWKLHCAGILHGDLNLRNIYRTDRGVCGVIDLDGCRILNKVPSPEWRCKDVARLASSALKTMPEEKRQIEPCAKLFASAYHVCGGEDFYGEPLLREIRNFLNH